MKDVIGRNIEPKGQEVRGQRIPGKMGSISTLRASCTSRAPQAEEFIDLGGRPIFTPRALARSRPSLVRARMRSRSNSARPPSTVSISRPCNVVVSAHVESIRMSGVFTPRRLERDRQHFRLPTQGTISQRAAGACHRARESGSVAAGARRVWSTASAGAWRSAC
jgi:hypothetical protein